MSAIVSPPTTERATPPDLNALVIHLGPLKHKLTDDEFFEFCAQNPDLTRLAGQAASVSSAVGPADRPLAESDA